MLLPGMDGTCELYMPLMEALSEFEEISAPAYPTASYLNYEALLPRVVAAGPQKPFVLVAESYSTPLAIRYAATRPANLKGLVLCAGFASSPVRGWRRWATWMLSPILFRLPKSDAAVRHFLLGAGASQELIRDVREAIGEVKPKVLGARLREILRCDARAELAKIDVPVLYLAAEWDTLVGPECLEEILRAKSDVDVERIPGPHLLFQREPALGATAIEEFVRRIQPRNGG